nr:hypothetical protein [Tanacetum cinerariifolium]
MELRANFVEKCRRDHRDTTPSGGESCVLFRSARVSKAVFLSSPALLPNSLEKNENNIIKRWNSEPTLLRSVDEDHRDTTPPGGESCVLFHSARVSKTIFSSSPEFLPNSLEKNE